MAKGVSWTCRGFHVLAEPDGGRASALRLQGLPSDRLPHLVRLLRPWKGQGLANVSEPGNRAHRVFVAIRVGPVCGADFYVQAAWLEEMVLESVCGADFSNNRYLKALRLASVCQVATVLSIGCLHQIAPPIFDLISQCL